jgi:hypothetical protein
MNAPLWDFQPDGNDAIDWRPGKVWSLWDMLKLSASSFTRAIASLRHIQTFIDFNKDSAEKVLSKDNRQRAAQHIDELIQAVVIIGMPITIKSIGRLKDRLDSPGITYQELGAAYLKIETRVHDELDLVSVFVLAQEKAKLFEPREPLFGSDFEGKFASAGVYEVDEAAKCMALGRDTAAVFHLMRCMEIGIRTVAKSLGIPDPVKGADRNWNEMLKKIKTAMDARFNPPTWKPGDQEIFQSAYGSLDAVRVAWRNTTMHVENKYSAEEAEHIFVATRGFMKKLVSRMDEQGMPLA